MAVGCTTKNRVYTQKVHLFCIETVCTFECLNIIWNNL